MIPDLPSRRPVNGLDSGLQVLAAFNASNGVVTYETVTLLCDHADGLRR